MPRVRIGNTADLQVLSDDALATLVHSGQTERLLRRFQPDEVASEKKMPDQRVRYVSWSDACSILIADGDKPRTAAHRASRLWGVLQTEKRFNLPTLDGHCSVCRALPGEPYVTQNWPVHRFNCSSYRASTHSASTLEYSRGSLITNLPIARKAPSSFFNNGTLASYGRIVRVLQ